MATSAPSTATTPRSVRPIVNLFALGSVLTINALANIVPINGLTTGEISDRFASLFTPAGYVFSIWGLIYALLIVFAVYQALPSQQANPRLERLGYAFALSCLFNSLWIFAWHYQQILLSQLLMLALLATLIACYERLGIGRNRVGTAEAVATRLPFSVYLGWITVATVANTTITLLDLGVTGGWLAPLWAAVAIVAAVAIGYLMLRNRGDVAFVLVLVWAFVGIAAKQWGAEVLVVGTALAAAAVVATLAGQRLLRRNRFAS